MVREKKRGAEGAPLPLPLRRAQRGDLRGDAPDDSADVAHDVLSRDAEDGVPEKLELPLTVSIVPLLPVVGAAIDFDDERRGRDEDVDDVRTDDHLTTSAKAERLTRTKRVPQELLRACGRPTHEPRVLELVATTKEGDAGDRGARAVHDEVPFARANAARRSLPAKEA